MLRTAMVMVREVGRRQHAAFVPIGLRQERLTSLPVYWIPYAAWILLAAVPTADAAQWRGTLNLSASETFTDNVSLTPAASATSDFVTRVTPGFSLRGDGPRLHVSIDYALDAYTYLREDQLNRTNHSLAASAKSELAKNWLFLDANAAISQQNVSLLGPIGLDNNTSNTNQSEVQSFLISPYIRNRFGSYANYELRYQYDRVSSDSDSLANSSSNKYSATIVSGPAFNSYTWDLKLYKDYVYFNEAGTQGQENITADIRYFLTPRFALTASTGYEKYDYISLGDNPKGSFWSAGIFWQPSTLTTLNASVGDRFFGRAYTFDFSHRSRRLLWKATYSENFSTTRSNFLIPQNVSTFDYISALVAGSIPDPALRAQLVAQYIAARGLPPTIFNSVNFFSNRAFLEKRADASVTYSSPKTTTVLSFFHDVRDATEIGSTNSALFGSGDFNDSVNIRQQGASLLFNWAFWPHTNADINFGYNKTVFRDSDREEDLKFIRLGLRRQMTRKMTGAVDYRYATRDSNVASARYRENAVTASINVQF